MIPAKEKTLCLLPYLCILAAFSFPVKLSASYAILIPAILILVIYERERILAFFRCQAMQPLIALLAALLFASLVGVNPLHSLKSLQSLYFFTLVIPLFALHAPLFPTIAALFTGQSIAALHTVFEGQSPFLRRNILLGSVTESGQLALTSIVLIGFIFSNRLSLRALILSWASLLLLLLALIINLKRGPWLGFYIGTACFLLSIRRYILAALFTLSPLLALLIPSVIERIAASYQDFNVPGGRSLIWSIGGDLITQLPLGIGYGNSRVVRQFSEIIPPELRHFHCNVINVAVEGGFLAVAALAWMVTSFVAIGFRGSILKKACAAAIIAWQVAGVVEYNIGDSEVLLVAFMCLALILKKEPQLTSSNTDPQLKPAPTTATAIR